MSRNSLDLQDSPEMREENSEVTQMKKRVWKKYLFQILFKGLEFALLALKVFQALIELLKK